MSKDFVIGIDFDGTIVDHKFPDIGAPCPGALEWIKTFISLGAKIVLWTMRSDGQKHGDVLTEAVDYLRRNGVELYGVNRNPTQDEWTHSHKAYCHVYIDDAAYGCPLVYNFNGSEKPMVDWSEVGPAVRDMILEHKRV